MASKEKRGLGTGLDALFGADSYDEGGYEARSSNFRAGVAEFIISEGKILLKEMLS